MRGRNAPPPPTASATPAEEKLLAWVSYIDRDNLVELVADAVARHPDLKAPAIAEVAGVSESSARRWMEKLAEEPSPSGDSPEDAHRVNGNVTDLLVTESVK